MALGRGQCALVVLRRAYDHSVEQALVPRAERETLTCLVVMDRLLDCVQIEQIIADHGASLGEIRAAIRTDTEQSASELPDGGRWRASRSYFDGELSAALGNVGATAKKQRVPASATCLVQAMLASSSTLRTRVAPFGMQASWFDRTSSE
jgi:hypothetical protein